MTRKIALAAGALALLMVTAGCVSGLGGGGEDSGAATAGVIIQHETVPGHEGFPENNTSALVKPCVPLGTFATGMQPAWHVYVIDPSTGEKLTNETVDSVTVKLGTGREVPTEFHTDDSGWHGCFVLPEDHKTGEVSFTIIVEVGEDTYKQTGTIEVVEEL